MIGRTTEQWIFFSALKADGWFREDLASVQVIPGLYLARVEPNL